MAAKCTTRIPSARGCQQRTTDYGHLSQRVLPQPLAYRRRHCPRKSSRDALCRTRADAGRGCNDWISDHMTPNSPTAADAQSVPDPRRRPAVRLPTTGSAVPLSNAEPGFRQPKIVRAERRICQEMCATATLGAFISPERLFFANSHVSRGAVNQRALQTSHCCRLFARAYRTVPVYEPASDLAGLGDHWNRNGV